MLNLYYNFRLALEIQIAHFALMEACSLLEYIDLGSDRRGFVQVDMFAICINVYPSTVYKWFYAEIQCPLKIVLKHVTKNREEKSAASCIEYPVSYVAFVRCEDIENSVLKLHELPMMIHE